MSTTLQLQSKITTNTEPTPRALQVAVMFGLSLDAGREQVIIPPIELDLAPGRVLFITGVSGGGKSTLLRLIHQALVAQHTHPPGIVRVDHLPQLPDQPLIEALAMPEVQNETPEGPASFETVCRWFSRAGLNDAAVMLRRPSELSEGQRHRLRLAQAMAVAERQQRGWSVLLADEFGSSLDRATARALARSVRRWVTRTNVCLVAATAHDDLLEPYCPDVLVEVAPGGRCAVHDRRS